MWAPSPDHPPSPFCSSLPLMWLLRCEQVEGTGVGIQDPLHPAPTLDCLCGPGQFLVHPGICSPRSWSLACPSFPPRELGTVEGLWREPWVPLRVALGPASVSLANEDSTSPPLLTQAGDTAGWEPRTPQGLRGWHLLPHPSCFLPLSHLPLHPSLREALLAHMTPPPAVTPHPFSSTLGLIFSQFSVPFPYPTFFPSRSEIFILSLPLQIPCAH